MAWRFYLHFLLILIVAVVKLAYGNAPDNIHRRFEYKYSFKPPYLAQKDGTVPFWEYGGNAIASSDSVRIAPSLRSQKGAIWTKNPTNFDWWQIEVVFRVSGRGRIGADGLAIWYTSDKGDYNGEVFGSSDKWRGLGLFFDSFDNDNKHNNPYIMAVLNDGTRQFDHQNDGTTQLLSGCLRDFRNKPFPTRARIEYYQNSLTVTFHNGITNNNEDYEICLRAEGVVLPKNGYFGVSAATGGLADDHDVFHFLTTSLHAPGEGGAPGTNQLLESDSEKLTLEYQEYQKKLQQQKDIYHKDHPEEAEKDEYGEWLQDSERELRQIWQSQSAMTEVMRDMSRKIDEVIGRQERTLGLLSVGGPGQIQPQQGIPPPHQVPPGQFGGGTMQRHEIDALLNNQGLTVSVVQEIRTYITDVQKRLDAIQNRQGAAVGYDVQSMVSEMRDGLNTIKHGLSALAQKGGTAQMTGCPTINCLGVTTFLAVTVIQLGIVFGYTLFRQSRESQSKKFY